MSAAKPVIGICGGMGAGKSTIGAILERLGCVVIDSDRQSHEILETPDVQERLRAWWGPDVVAPDGRTDRRRIADIVFSDPEAKRRLESLVHPLIARRRADIISQSSQDPTVRAIILDSPLLFESGLDQECDCILFIDVPEATRIERLAKLRGWNLAELRRRESWQRPLEEKRRKADYIIENDDTLEQLQSRVAAILEKVTKKHTSF